MAAKLETQSKLILALCGLALALTSCGAKNTAVRTSTSSSSSSTAPRGTVPSTTLPTTVVGADCNQFSASTGRFSGKLRSYYDANNKMQEEMIRLRVNTAEAKLDSQSNVQIKFFRWNADSSGTTNLDSTPLRFRLEYRNNSAIYPLSSYVDYLSKADIQGIAANNSGLSSTPSEFLRQVDIVVMDLAYTWQALKAVIYEDSTVLAMADMLLPVYAANPNVYSTNHPSVLNQLHPLWTDRSAARTDAQYLNLTASYCF